MSSPNNFTWEYVDCLEQRVWKLINERTHECVNVYLWNSIARSIRIIVTKHINITKQLVDNKLNEYSFYTNTD